MDLRNFYNTIGEDYDLLLKRLLSSERIEKYVSIFFSDNDVDDLKTQIFNNNIQSAIITAHTLKGVTATLGFDHLSDDICELHTALKNDETEKAEVLCQQIVDKCDHIHKVWSDCQNI